MAELNVNFQHPIDQRVITVTVDDSMTADEAISELLANNFVLPIPGNYDLYDGKTQIRGDQTFAEAGVRTGARLRLNPNSLAGSKTRSSR